MIEINSNTVAMMKLPVPVKELGKLVDSLTRIYGQDLSMAEQPEGWLTFFKPEKPEPK